MHRHMSREVPRSISLAGRWTARAAVLVGLAGPVRAEPAAPPSVPPGSITSDGLIGRRITVDTPIDRHAAAFAQVSGTIFVNRCVGSCAVHKGTNDARTNTSTIPMAFAGNPGPNFTVSEFKNSAGATGAAADAEWSQVMQCMKDVYSPFNVTVTDVRPGDGAAYHQAIIAGDPGEVGLAHDILGVAPLASDCSAIDNVMSFSFANLHDSRDGVTARVFNICWTAAQESAHAYGLDHEFSFTTGNAANGHSACNDPMTYRNDCGGQKFFRNQEANCGETSSRACKCGATQNSHLKLVSVFGTGRPITGNPTVAVTSLTAGGSLAGSVAIQAGAKRGVSRVELYFNGFKWAEQGGVAFGMTGQPNPGSYGVRVPDTLPNSIVDVKAVAFDDLGASTESATVTVTKGAPCTTADTCAKGQKCEAGKCFWDPPSGEIGDSCSYEQFCKSQVCTGTQDQLICTQNCIPGVTDSCPSGFQCLASSVNAGVCFFEDSGGCCSVDGGSGRTWWVHAALAAVVLGWVARRRRRR
jgi:MYXO-CTERM domain-containing protein